VRRCAGGDRPAERGGPRHPRPPRASPPATRPAAPAAPRRCPRRRQSRTRPRRAGAQKLRQIPGGRTLGPVLPDLVNSERVQLLQTRDDSPARCTSQLQRPHSPGEVPRDRGPHRCARRNGAPARFVRTRRDAPRGQAAAGAGAPNAATASGLPRLLQPRCFAVVPPQMPNRSGAVTACSRPPRAPGPPSTKPAPARPTHARPAPRQRRSPGRPHGSRPWQPSRPPTGTTAPTVALPALPFSYSRSGQRPGWSAQ
jgi:hypothetical protein